VGKKAGVLVKKVNLSIEKKSYGVRESIRTLRTNLQFCGDDKRVILVTSCVPREGKSSVSVALAESIADMGKSVILVDADIRKSVMASKLQITGADKGLSHFLSGQCVLADVIMATNIPKFHILLSGPEAPRTSGIQTFYRYAGVYEECL
jgi:capsular exopolysaccharide synthesis family protein